MIYHGQTSLQTPAGQIPLNFDLEADNMQDAIKAFPKLAQAEANRVMAELEEMQRQQQASQQGGDGGGRIQMP